jgi:ribosome-associated translation inhibitor RaiA
MEIDIRGAGLDVGDRLRAYVEYRMFSLARRFAPGEARLHVRIEPACRRGRPRYRCVAGIAMRRARSVQVTATSDLLHSAVDRAAEQLSRRAQQRIANWPFPRTF